jgi:tRNA/tmRNA/rRNA uracil-C5-methylase (TrmA/RlmC/RlmD family)
VENRDRSGERQRSGFGLFGGNRRADRGIEFRFERKSLFLRRDDVFSRQSVFNRTIIETATANASGAAALDLYCGVGLFTLPLAKNSSALSASKQRKAIDFAEKSVENARIENVRLVAKMSANGSRKTERKPLISCCSTRRAPERKRKSSKVCLKIKPREISYVSCEPSTLARDLRVLCDGGYRIESIVALDLFPQTHHVETVVRLKLES